MINEPPSRAWVVVIVAIIGAVGVIIAAIIGLGMPFAERIADRYYPPLTPTTASGVPSGASNPEWDNTSSSLAVQLPNDLSCQQHSSGFCGLTMNISWSNIDSNSEYYLYTIGHGLNYQPEMWWVAGTGVPINTASGNWTVNDGAYGKIGDSLGVFACLTKTRYSFTGVKEIKFTERPDCEAFSTEVYFQPK